MTEDHAIEITQTITQTLTDLLYNNREKDTVSIVPIDTSRLEVISIVMAAVFATLSEQCSDREDISMLLIIMHKVLVDIHISHIES